MSVNDCRFLKHLKNVWNCIFSWLENFMTCKMSAPSAKEILKNLGPKKSNERYETAWINFKSFLANEKKGHCSEVTTPQALDEVTAVSQPKRTTFDTSITWRKKRNSNRPACGHSTHVWTATEAVWKWLCAKEQGFTAERNLFPMDHEQSCHCSSLL